MDRASPPAGAERVIVEEGRSPRPRRRTWVVATVLVLLVAVGLVYLGYVRGSSGPRPITQADVDQAVQQGIQRAEQQQLDAPTAAATAYRVIQPSLVTVTAQVAGADSGELGAGIVLNASGQVMTALHVVADGLKPGGVIHVQFADGTTSTATVAQQEPANDIAVLSVGRLPSVVVPAVLGGGAQVGDPVFPVGHPLGLTDSLTAGVVSAVGRSVHSDTGATLTGLIQFDAAVNPGNSGGPLLDRNGQVVGIVTGLANPSGQKYFVGIGFAVPIEAAGQAAGVPAQ